MYSFKLARLKGRCQESREVFMSPEQKGHDPKTPLTGMSGRESVFDRRLHEYRNTGGFAKPKRNTLEYLKKPTAEFETPSLDSKLHARAIETEEYTETERLLFVDESSGLLNSRTMMSKLAAELRRSARYKHNFSIFVMELDGLTTMHAATPLAVEMIFLSFCKVLTKNIREADIVGRFDLSSVMVICPETDLNEAVTEAYRLRDVVCETRFKQLGYQQNLSVSVGVACYGEHGKVAADLLGSAMEAAQQAVANGGNIVCTAKAAVTTDRQPILVAPTEDFSPTPQKARKDEEVQDMSPTADKPSVEGVFPTVNVSPVIT
jgi:diguanylate cyclase (GGDEF)-like protein